MGMMGYRPGAYLAQGNAMRGGGAGVTMMPWPNSEGMQALDPLGGSVAAGKKGAPAAMAGAAAAPAQSVSVPSFTAGYGGGAPQPGQINMPTLGIGAQPGASGLPAQMPANPANGINLAPWGPNSLGYGMKLDQPTTGASFGGPAGSANNSFASDLMGMFG